MNRRRSSAMSLPAQSGANDYMTLGQDSPLLMTGPRHNSIGIGPTTTTTFNFVPMKEGIGIGQPHFGSHSSQPSAMFLLGSDESMSSQDGAGQQSATGEDKPTHE
jgi:hypothetical protein